MTDNLIQKHDDQKTDPTLSQYLSQIAVSGRKHSYARFAMAALGSLPWVGGLFGASSALHAEKEQGKINTLQKLWLEEHEEKIILLAKMLHEIFTTFDTFTNDIQQRLDSQEYLNLVQQGFAAWDQANTQEKRQLIQKLLTNAGAIQLCTDDLIRLFIDWIDQYHEAHFKVIKIIYENPEISKGKIWDKLHPIRPREDSPEADLYKLLFDDLTIGHVIRQKRETDPQGNFIKKRRTNNSPQTKIAKSAFNEVEPYVLTELGKQFVHYAMDDVAPQLE